MTFRLTNMDRVVEHSELDEALKRCGSSWNAGQVHGLLCSRLSVAGADSAAEWIAQVLAGAGPENEHARECASLLDSLFAHTWRQLVGRQSDFVLLLPDDEDPADLRAAAMANWCEGFLHGLVAEKHSEELKKRLAAEPLSDIIKDMLEITRATTGDDGDEEHTESAYVELVEYLRVAVQLTYEELAEFREPVEDILPDESDTLH
jgi:uncharacterized protein YgfB (UPF0149 family)